MAKRKCETPDASSFDKLITFLRAPDELTDTNEVAVRTWSDWRSRGKAYSRWHTAGSRQFSAASQQHQAVDAVVETPWTRSAAAIDTTDAIKLAQGTTVSYWLILAVINVDMNNQLLRFVCRKTDSSTNTNT